MDTAGVKEQTVGEQKNKTTKPEFLRELANFDDR